MTKLTRVRLNSFLLSDSRLLLTLELCTKQKKRESCNEELRVTLWGCMPSSLHPGRWENIPGPQLSSSQEHLMFRHGNSLCAVRHRNHPASAKWNLPRKKIWKPTDATLQTNGLTTMSFSRCHAMTLGRKSTSQHQKLPKYMVEFGLVLASHLCALF